MGGDGCHLHHLHNEWMVELTQYIILFFEESIVYSIALQCGQTAFQHPPPAASLGLVKHRRSCFSNQSEIAERCPIVEEGGREMIAGDYARVTVHRMVRILIR